MWSRAKKNKKAVSIMIGYVLLVTSAIVISVIVYQWIKTYVPKDAIECPAGVSIFIKESSYDCDLDQMKIVIKNNGRFDIAGYFIYASNDPEQELAFIDLSQYTPLGENNEAVIFSTFNSLTPGEEKENIFYLSGSEIGNIYSIEIIPLRYQEEERKRLVSCSESKIKKVLDVDC